MQKRQKMTHMWDRFGRDAAGAAVIEFAFALPLLLMLFYGAVEVTRFMLFREKMESAAIQIGDIIGQRDEISAGDLETVFTSIPQFMSGFNASNVLPLVTVVERSRRVLPTHAPCRLKRLWSYPSANAAITKINPEGNDGLPGFGVSEGDVVMVVELAGTFRSLLGYSVTARSNTLDVGSSVLTSERSVLGFTRARYGAFRCNPTTRLCASAACY